MQIRFKFAGIEDINQVTSFPSPLLLKEKGTGVEVVRYEKP